MSDPLSEHILRTAVEKPDDSNPLNVLNRIAAYENMAHAARKSGDERSFSALMDEADSLRDLYKRLLKAGVEGWPFWDEPPKRRRR
jgi:hypothetical protein